MRNRDRGLMLGILLGLGVGGYAVLRARSHPVPNHPCLTGDSPLVMAHRGGQGLWPPNTLYAFEHAVALEVDVLELDIHSTVDGVLVVRHDPTVDATTNGSGFIRDLTLAEIKSLDAGYRWTADAGQSFPYRQKGITIPTLEEVLVAFPGIRLNIDIKPQDPAIIDPFVRLLEQYGRTRSVVVGSFHDDQLARFRLASPQTATAAGVRETQLLYGLNLFHLGEIYQPRANAFQIPEYSGRLHVVTPSFVRAAHSNNMQVHVWTVNDTGDMQRLLDWGLDGIITDYPDRLMQLLGRTKPR